MEDRRHAGRAEYTLKNRSVVAAQPLVHSSIDGFSFPGHRAQPALKDIRLCPFDPVSQFNCEAADPRPMLCQRYALGLDHARAIKPQRCLPSPIDAAQRKRKQSTRQRFGVGPELLVDATAAFVGKKDAGTVGSLIQCPASTYANVRGHVEFSLPIVFVELRSFFAADVNHQIATTGAAGLARPSLPGYLRHEYRKRHSGSHMRIVSGTEAYGNKNGAMEGRERCIARKAERVLMIVAAINPQREDA